MHKSLALLVAGSLKGDLLAKHGDYTRIFSQFFAASVPQGAHVEFTLDPYDVVHEMEYPSEDKIDSYDALVLTGSASNAYDDLDWINKFVAYIARIAATKPHVKIIAICFGHQIVARALGGECVPNDGKWEVGPTPIQLTDLGKRIFGVDSLNIQQMHRDHVPSVPPPFHLLGSTPVSPNQGMLRFSSDKTETSASMPQFKDLTDVHILTLQGHPEFTEPIVSGIVEQRSRDGIIDLATAADAETRKDWRNDGVAVLGKAVWGILGVRA